MHKKWSTSNTSTCTSEKSGVQVCMFIYSCCTYTGKSDGIYKECESQSGNVIKLRLGDIVKLSKVIEKIEINFNSNI